MSKKQRLIRALRERVIKVSSNNCFWGFVLLPFLWFWRRRYYQFLPEKYVIRANYRRSFGSDPNLSAPESLNEKIQWLKLYDRTSLHTQCADKYMVRSYVENIVGSEYLIPLLYHTDNPRQIVREQIPDIACIIKVNNDSGGGIIVRDKNSQDWKQIQKHFSRKLKSSYYRLKKEWQYKEIKPLIIVEQLLQDDDGEVPLDYKFHCFHGRVEVIGVDLDRFSKHRRNFYNRNWELMPFVWSPISNEGEALWPNGRSIERPKCLEEMISIAEQLSRAFVYCRVDLYLLGEQIFFGEITFHHGGGCEVFSPAEWDKKLGNFLDLSKLV